MPIKPEHRHRYPKNWSDIRASVLDRAQFKCEQCGVDQYAVGYRSNDGGFVYAAGSAYYDQMMYAVDYKTANSAKEILSQHGQKHIVIVLTIAHLDHTPENNDIKNLMALCQKCHLAYDQNHHTKNARNTRASKRLQLDMTYD